MSNPNPSTSSPHHPKFSQLNDTPLRLPSRTASTSVTVSQTPTLPTKRNPRAPFNLRRRRASSYDELTAGRPGLISTAPFSSASIRPKPWSSHRHQNSSKSSGGSGTSNLFSGAAIAYSTFPSVSPAVASALWAEETESPIGEPLSLGEVLDHRPAAHFSEDEDEEEPVYHRRHRRTASSESFLIAHQTPPPAAVSSNNNNSTTGNSKFGRFGFIKPKGIRLKRRTRSASPGTEYTPAYTSPNFRHQTSLSDTPGSPTSSPINPVEHLDANLISVQSGALQSFLLSIMDPSITTTPFSWFFRGLFFGALVVIVTEALILYKVATWLFNPARPAPHTVIHPDTVDEAEEETRGRQKTKVVGDEDLLQTGMGEANSNIFQAPDPHYHPEEWPDTMVEYLKMALSRSPEDVPVIPPKSTANPPPPAGTNMPGGPNIAAPGSSVQAGAAEGYYVDPPMYAGPSESVHWLNVALHRFFMELRVSPTFKDKLKKKMSDKISMKLQGNSFLADVRLTDILLGDNVPIINSIRVLKTITEDLAVMLEGDLTYMGGGSVTLEVTLTSGIMIPARVYLEKLSGKVRIRVPAVVAPDMMGLAFEEDPGANLRVDTPITVRDNEFVRDLVNKVLGKLVRKVFLEQWVLPAWRVFFLPMMEPAPAVSLIRMDKYSSTTARPLPPHRRHGGLTSRYEHLWAQSTAPENLSKRRSGLPVPSQHHWDIFSGRSFPLTTIVSDSPTEPDRLENALVPLFMNLVREDSEDGGFEEEEGGAVGAAWNTSGWRTLKHRGGIHVQRKRVSVGGHIAEVMRAFVKVQCDPARVYGVLSKPDHQMHVEETFLRSDVIKHFDERRAVRHMAYQAGRSATKEYLAFEVKKTIVNEETKAKETAPATHSAAPLTEASTKGKEPASGATASAPTPAISINKPSEAFIYVCRSVAGVRENQGTPPTPTAETSPTSLPAGSEKPAATTAPPSDETPAVPGPRHRKVTPNANAVASEETAATGSSPSASRTASRSSKFSFPGTSSSGTGSNHGTYPVHVFGYHVEAVPGDPQSSTVTIVSQFSQELQRLDVSFSYCRKLKAFIEELTNLSGGVPAGGNLGGNGWLSGNELRRRKVSGHTGSFGPGSGNQGGGEEGGKRIEKLRSYVGTGVKSYVGNAANYIMKNRRVAGWLQRESSTGSLSGDRRRGHGSGGAGTGGSSTEVLFDDDGMDDGFGGTELTLMSGSGVQNVGMDDGGDEKNDAMVLEDVGYGGSPPVSVPGQRHRDADADSVFGASTPALTPYALSFGGGLGGSSDEDDFRGEDVIAKTAFDDAPFENRKIVGREVVRVEVGYVKEASAAPEGYELAWEFFLRTDQQIQFAILFEPESSDGQQKEPVTPDFTGLLSETMVRKGDRVLVPLTSTNAHYRSARGVVSVGSLSNGTFVLLWDNTTVQKKATKDLMYRVVVQRRTLGIPAELAPVAPWSSPASLALLVPGLGTPGQWLYTTGGTMEVAITRKTVFRLPVIYDSSCEAEGVAIAGPGGCTTYLAWEFSTGGSDIVFGVLFTPESAVSSTSVSPKRPGLVRRLSGNSMRSFKGDEHGDDDAGSASSGGSKGATPQKRRNSIGSRLAAVVGAAAGVIAAPSSDEQVDLDSPPSSTVVPGPVVATVTQAAPVYETIVPLTKCNSRATGSGGVVGSSYNVFNPMTVTGIVLNHGAVGDRLSLPVAGMGGVGVSGGGGGGGERPAAISTLSGSVGITGRRGVYTFVWDNTASIVSTRTIAFRAGIVSVWNESASAGSLDVGSRTRT